MTCNPRALTPLLLVCSVLLAPCSLLRADGGAVRLYERAGNYKIAVFTSPTPFRAGPVDVSVLVQDAATGELLPEAQVIVRLTERSGGRIVGCQAVAEAATNKLFQAAVFFLPGPGRWDAEVDVEGPLGSARVRFEVDAAEPAPRWLEVWPWFGWPALAVALFAVHQVLACRKVRDTRIRGACATPFRGSPGPRSTPPRQ